MVSKKTKFFVEPFYGTKFCFSSVTKFLFWKFQNTFSFIQNISKYQADNVVFKTTLPLYQLHKLYLILSTSSYGNKNKEWLYVTQFQQIVSQPSFLETYPFFFSSYLHCLHCVASNASNASKRKRKLSQISNPSCLSRVLLDHLPVCKKETFALLSSFDFCDKPVFNFSEKKWFAQSQRWAFENKPFKLWKETLQMKLFLCLFASSLHHKTLNPKSLILNLEAQQSLQFAFSVFV